MAITTGTELINPITVLGAANVREGFKVADLGCGTSGHYVLPATELVGRSGKVYAVDIMRSALEATKSRAELRGSKNIEYIWGDIERPRGVALSDETLNVALIVNNLFLAKEKAKMGHEALRLLKSGGKLILVDWKPTDAPFGPPPDARVGSEEAQVLMQSVGFRFLDRFTPGPYHYGLVFEKP